jgi:hypothetical protein
MQSVGKNLGDPDAITIRCALWLHWIQTCVIRVATFYRYRQILQAIYKSSSTVNITVLYWSVPAILGCVGLFLYTRRNTAGEFDHVKKNFSQLSSSKIFESMLCVCIRWQISTHHRSIKYLNFMATRTIELIIILLVCMYKKTFSRLKLTISGNLAYFGLYFNILTLVLS